MPEFLDKIISHKKGEIQSLYSEKGLDYFREKAGALSNQRATFYDAISQNGLSLIAEIKKASPSKGIIREDFDPLALAQHFQKANASALSILTETHFFMGSADYIPLIKSHVQLPILRKDFIIDPIQVYESKCLGADAILLIKAILSDNDCQSLLNLADSLALDVLVEVHNEEELTAVLSLDGLKMIGINNRHLKDFSVDINLAHYLYQSVQDKGGICFVAESGYSNKEQVEALNESGFSAVLIGEGLARHEQLIQYWQDYYK